MQKGAQTLGGKDAKLFKDLSKHYEKKEFRKGLKNAEKLLEKYPDHPETLALYGLFLSKTGEEDKGIEIVKKGLLKSMFKSQLCWHSMGIIYRQKRNYIEAIKANQNALKSEPDNAQMLRDTAMMQVHARDHVGHVATRFEILKQKPSLIHNWASFMIANHLKQEYPDARKALESIKSLLTATNTKPHEKSNISLYECIIEKDAGNFEQLYTLLKKNQKEILDKVMFRHYLLEACQKLNKKEESLEIIESLLKEFPENLDYFQLYAQVQNVDSSNRTAMAEFYDNAAKKFSSKIAKIYRLSYLQDDLKLFKTEFLNFVIPYYKKNLISLFREIKLLYENPLLVPVMGEVFFDLEVSLKENKYPNGEEAASPSEYLWALYLKAQHLTTNFDTLPEALDLINKAIAHTSTIPQLYIAKAKIHYNLHNPTQAVQTINEARKMDLADRYMNNICVKYLLKFFQANLAQDMMRLFMKEEASSYELQNMWYQIAVAKCHLRQRNFGAGLKHLDFIQKQFGDMYEDQFDFHSYSIRTWNLREYLELIAYMDDIYNDRKYMEAAGEAIRYLLQYRHFPVKKEKANKHAKPIEDPREIFREKIDYYGKKYLDELKDPLEQAFIWAKNSTTAKYVNKGNSKINRLYFEAFAQSIVVFIEKNKPLLVLKALKKLQKTGVAEEEIHLHVLKALLFFEKTLKDEKLNPLTAQILKEAMVSIMGTHTNPLTYHQEVIKGWAVNYPNTLRKLICDVIIKGESRTLYIDLYRTELKKELPLKDTLDLVHRLEFYGEFTPELRDSFNQKFGANTSYFTDFKKSILDLPKAEWVDWWFSEYDLQREWEDEGKKPAGKDSKKEQTKQGGNKQETKGGA